MTLSLLRLALVTAVVSLSLGGCSSEDLGAPPESTLTASVSEGVAPLSVTFTVTVAEGTDYTVKQYEWDFEGDDTVDQTSTKEAPTATFVYTAVGDYAPVVKIVFNEADAWSKVFVNGSLQPSVHVVAAP